MPTPVRVLVVDDDEMSRELLSVLLEADGYAVDSADSGQAALAHLRSSSAPPDLILSDMQMPGITGPALANEVRSIAGGSPVLLAMSGSQPAEESLSHFDGFLLKPFKVDQLAETVKGVQRQRAKTSSRRPDASGKVVPISSALAGGDAPSATVPVLNDSIYRQLTRAMPAQQLDEMYTLCINDARERIRRMRGSAADNDSAQFVREAHAIKGSAGMLGATQLHTMASGLETRGLSAPGGAADAVNSLDELSAACDRLERMLGSRA
ncbi:MAG TPA: response regulator [Acidobacteriaceae bacterium]|nr:response regulator [Acidobacteriaceae bacterium]